MVWVSWGCAGAVYLPKRPANLTVPIPDAPLLHQPHRAHQGWGSGHALTAPASPPRPHRHGEPSFHYDLPYGPRSQQPTPAQVAISADLGRDHGRGAGVPAMLVLYDGLLAE